MEKDIRHIQVSGRIMTVILPVHYADENRSYPVIYLLDGDEIIKRMVGLPENGRPLSCIMIGVNPIDRLADYGSLTVE